jgi:hypothetical protein
MMKRLTRETLLNMTDQLAAHRWRAEELAELVEPQLGIITGFQDLLDDLERLRNTDLSFTAPALGIWAPVKRDG